MIISILIAFYEEQQSQKNVYIIVIAIVFFMIGVTLYLIKSKL